MISMSAQLHGDYWKEEHYLSELNRKWELSFAILEDSQMLGFMIVSDKGTAHHLHRIVVKQNQAGKGYGKQMLNKLIGDAKAADKENVTLKVHPSNTDAIKIYEKYGFNKVGADGENFSYSLKMK